MINRAELKENAKKSLNGRYGDAIVVLLLTSIIGGFAGGIQGFGEVYNNFFLISMASILSLIITSFLAFGSLSFFLKVARNEEADYRELFTKFNMFVPYIIISLVTSVFVFLWSILFIIPGIIAGLAYSQVYYIALDNPEMDAMEVLKTSKEMMKGYKLEYFILQLSFIGWSILGIFTCGILYFWLIPYISVTNCNFYDKIKEEYEKKNEPQKENIKKETVEDSKPKENKKTVIIEEEKIVSTDKKPKTSSKSNSTNKNTTKNSSKSKPATTKKNTSKPVATKTTSTKKTSTTNKNTTKKSNNSNSKATTTKKTMSNNKSKK